MKILFITSFYSALKDSVYKDKWKPEGMPAISKLFEGLKEKNQLFDVFFIDNSTNKNKIKIYKNSFFNINIKVFSFSILLNFKFLRNFSKSFNDIKFLFDLIYKYNISQYKVIYVDRSNLVIGAFLAFLGYSVILRLHGVNVLNDNFSSILYKLSNPIKILSLIAPFKYVIASEDGSPSKQFLDKYFLCKNKKAIINGVDKMNNKYEKSNLRAEFGIDDKSIIFLFVGRLTKDKGILDFLNSLVTVQKKNTNFYSIIVGTGDLYDEAKNIIFNNKLTNVRLVGSVQHSEIYKYYKVSDVYFSLNKIGNLSNTVLEAVNYEKCIVTFKKCVISKRDLSTYDFFGDNVIYIDRNKINLELAKIMFNILEDNKIIVKMQNKILSCKKRLSVWSDRIQNEINLINL